MDKSYNAEEIFEIGVQIEVNGQDFYEKAAKTTEDNDIALFFQNLAQWEKVHISKFQKYPKVSECYFLI